MRSISILVLVAGCVGPSGPEGTKGMNGADGMNGLNGTTGVDGVSVTASSEAPGANCANGGSRFVSAAGTTFACNGTSGMNGVDGTSITANSEPAGANCATGGARFVAASGTTYACNGANGTSVSGRPEAPGANCANGGMSYASASGTHYVCNGAVGPPGPPGVVFNFTRVVPHTGNAATSGQALLDALAALSPPPGGGVRWKIQLDPGQYDIGANTLNLTSVALAGAGRQMTEITGAPATQLIVLTASELSDLSVDRTSTTADVVVRLFSDSRLHDVWVRKTLDSAVVSYFVQVAGQRCSLRDVRVEGTSSQTAQITGIVVQTSSPTLVRDVEVSLNVPNASIVYGISASGGNLILSDARVELTLGTGVANVMAIDVEGPSALDGDNVRVVLSGSSSAGAIYRGLYISTGQATLRGSHFTNQVSGPATTIAVAPWSSSTARIMASKFEGYANAIDSTGASPNFNVRIHHSVLDGARVGTVGTSQCTLVMTTAGAARAADCL